LKTLKKHFHHGFHCHELAAAPLNIGFDEPLIITTNTNWQGNEYFFPQEEKQSFHSRTKWGEYRYYPASPDAE